MARFWWVRRQRADGVTSAISAGSSATCSVARRWTPRRARPVSAARRHRDRAPPRLPRREPRRDHLGEHHAGSALSRVPRFRRQARYFSPSAARPGNGAGSKPSTRGPRSPRSAPLCGDAAWSRTSARTARVAASRFDRGRVCLQNWSRSS